ncbi:MAG: tRNA 2-thiouridine(34) synthase MnmA [Deltaproteobacteria bacterium CG11_big_fil_rev_8_21_14_0_20_45_16]|nr:MAG: tRNA 2-thiouridine(34) synthase MnmA [Deltaproteobacteria bacterium CG11_big_fil_rev_8_21_14_0_20_45_16]
MVALNSNAKRVLVAMSGGVDSSVAAYLLKKQGYEVIGITFQLYDFSRQNRKEGKGGCCSIEDVDDAKLVADRLGIKHYLINSREDFRKKVVDYFVSSYKRGLTPNPCVACNTFIKFDELEDQARILGIDYLATGHYARLKWDVTDGCYRIYRAGDDAKDQSYFLMGLDPAKFSKVLFPCGDYRKEEIRAFATEAGLCTNKKKESMEICFVPNNDYKSFLRQKAEVSSQDGDIVDERGNIVGRHSGIHNFTVGQRKGFGSLGLEAHYVVRLDAKKNQVVVGQESNLYSKGLIFEPSHFSAQDLERYFGKTLFVKIRSRSDFIPVRIVGVEKGGVFAEFEELQRAVTPGQFAVFYEEQKLIGGGTILEALPEMRSEQFGT